jgi:hypothetical protein
MLLTTAALMGLSIVGAAGLGHVLVERDDAVVRAAAAEKREAMCERGWHATNLRIAEFRAEVDEHLAIEEDGPCVCAVTP